MTKLHARFWKYTGNHPEGRDCERHDPHGFGIETIAAMAWLVDNDEAAVCGVSLDEVVVRHHKGDPFSFGHQVYVAATREQWEAAKLWLEQQAA
ncbi:MAG: hypothetical protein ACO3TI_07455 [Aquiluna sp.]